MAREAYLLCVAHSVMLEKKLWGKRFNLRRAMEIAAQVYRQNHMVPA